MSHNSDMAIPTWRLEAVISVAVADGLDPDNHPVLEADSLHQPVRAEIVDPDLHLDFNGGWDLIGPVAIGRKGDEQGLLVDLDRVTAQIGDFRAGGSRTDDFSVATQRLAQRQHGYTGRYRSHEPFVHLAGTLACLQATGNGHNVCWNAAAVPASIRQPREAGEMIRVQNLTRRFGDFVAVNDISFEVAAGEIFAFLGPNGAGKTTTIRMLTTLLSPTSGTLEVDGLNPAVKKNEVRQRFGIVFQDPSLDQDLSAWENMDLHGVLYHVPRKLRHERTETLLRAFELWERRDEAVKLFSGGMRRRLEIARGLLHTPKILFLDEPTLGLDPQTRNQLWTHVRTLNQTEGVTVFLTTHYMDEADRVASRIAVIDHGTIVATGSPAQLKEQTGKDSLEEAFLALTGVAIRDESVGAADRLRHMARMWRR
jgi:ABC-2 type transport system ATP-binding protein